jgi:hypothetical protein
MTLWIAMATVLGTTVLADYADAGGWRRRRGGCSDPYVTSYYYAARPIASPAGVASAIAPAAPALSCLGGPTTELQIVLTSAPAIEKRTVCSTEYRDEIRSRVIAGFKTIPVTEERMRVSTVMTPVTETKMVEYTSQVAVQGEESKTYTIKVPVWEDQEEAYTIKVPVLKEIEEQYTVKVPVLRDVPFTFTVNIPQPITRTVNRTVSNVVPVVKTRAVSVCVPQTVARTVSVDRGHWENQLVEGPAGRGAFRQVSQRRVWVPNVQTEEVTEVVQQPQTSQVEYLVYEQHYQTVPHDCVCIEYRPEQRQGTKKEVAYQDEVRTRMRTAVDYQDETRTRIKKVLSFRDEQRTETYPVVSFRPERFTKEVSYTVYVPETKAETYTVTRNDQVPDHRIENFTVRVPVPVVKEVDVQVTRMVPKVVAVTVNPCGGTSSPGQLLQPAQPPVTVVPASSQQFASAPVLCCGAQAAQ